jgi:hypothetical protein
MSSCFKKFFQFPPEDTFTMYFYNDLQIPQSPAQRLRSGRQSLRFIPSSMRRFQTVAAISALSW